MEDTSKFKRIAREPLRFEMTGVAKTTWYDWEKKGLAPRSIPLGKHARGYLISELEAWIEQRRAARDATA
jgi:prophage regulatory protein